MVLQALRSFVMLKLLDLTLEVVSVQPVTGLAVLLVLMKYPWNL